MIFIIHLPEGNTYCLINYLCNIYFYLHRMSGMLNIHWKLMYWRADPRWWCFGETVGTLGVEMYLEKVGPSECALEGYIWLPSLTPFLIFLFCAELVYSTQTLSPGKFCFTMNERKCAKLSLIEISESISHNKHFSL